MKIKIRTQRYLQQTLLNKLKMRVDNLLTYGEQLHDRIFSLGGMVWTNITSLSPTFLTKYLCQTRNISGHVHSK